MPIPQPPDRTPAEPTPAGPARVTVVESEACHFCDDAHRALADLSATFALSVERIDVRSDDGHRLMRQHRASMSPLVLLDGEFFSHGRLPRRKLEKTLTRRQAVRATVR